MQQQTRINKCILVIEDDLDLQEIIQVSLTAIAGLSVLIAGTGPEGVQMAHQENPDAILLDVMLPQMDGVEVFQYLQASSQTRNIPVIFMTSRTHHEDLHRLQQLGSKAAITKSFTPLQLTKRVLEILEWK